MEVSGGAEFVGNMAMKSRRLFSYPLGFRKIAENSDRRRLRSMGAAVTSKLHGREQSCVR